MEWRGGEFAAALEASFKDANMAAAREYVNQTRDLLNKGGKGPFSKGATPSPAGQPPHNSTGRLIKSFYAHEGPGISGYVSTNSPYAFIHEYGGTIVPKGKYLVFPVTIDGRRHLRAHVTIRAALGAPGVSIAPNRKGGGLLVFGKKGKKGRVLLYVMKKSVTLPARPYMRRALKEGTGAIAEAWFGKAMKTLKERIVRVIA